jgi:hypothetical protein
VPESLIAALKKYKASHAALCTLRTTQARRTEDHSRPSNKPNQIEKQYGANHGQDQAAEQAIRVDPKQSKYKAS